MPEPSTAASAIPQEQGKWQAPFNVPNVVIHAHVLPNGKVLFWGRRDHPTDSLDAHVCTPHIWDPENPTAPPETTPKPLLHGNQTTINLFCSGHTFLSDGRLLVVGGHIEDSEGLNAGALYDWRTNTWTALPPMNNGRWYPTAVTLRDGAALVLSGSYAGSNNTIQTNEVQQVWNGTVWHELVNFHGIPLYPRVHLAPDGTVFMAGPLAQTYRLDPHGAGTWFPLTGPGGQRAAGQRDYAPSVMYEPGKVLYIGGGNDPGTNEPTAEAEIIDLTAATPAWKPTKPMHFRRRQHNATLLPDGTVLVTGGTRGGGGPNKGFNDLRDGEPVHEAELWDPATGQWTVLAEEATDRCYHSIAVLLPDATVLSAGGGEYRPDSTDTPNPQKDSHRDAQIFHPPYLFRGERPKLTVAPAQTGYGAKFAVQTPDASKIKQVSWVRLSSITHSFNTGQRINFLQFREQANGLAVTAPTTPDVCPPGYYMLFLLTADKVPSLGKIIQISGTTPQPQRAVASPEHSLLATQLRMSTADLDREIRQETHGTHAVLGLTSTCPYGLAACWGGAYEALKTLSGVRSVRPVANAQDSTADVYMALHAVPDVDAWWREISHIAKGSYDLRGVEISIAGNIVADGRGVALAGPEIEGMLPLRPLGTTPKVQYDRANKRAQVSTPDEMAAYDQLVLGPGARPASTVRVTGILGAEEGRQVLHVRQFTQ
jgi:hypothetical protein